MNSKMSNELTDRFFKAALLLRDIDGRHSFFEDICTIAKVKALARRLEVARLLKSGMTYAEIGGRTGASTATTSSVKRFFKYGADGYNFVLGRLEQKLKTHLGENGQGCEFV